MRYYRVRLIGQHSGSSYVYSVAMNDDVPPIAAKEMAFALHGAEIAEGKAHETVYKQGVKVQRAPRCWSLRVRRWRLVRCCQDDAHHRVTKWHFSPHGDIWRIKHYD